jgi:hypothetical protein
MNTPHTEENVERNQQSLTTADLAAAAEPATGRRQSAREAAPDRRATEISHGDEELAPLFAADAAQDFRSRWDAVQSSFVDDPRQAVRQGDELVAQVMKSLAESFSNERQKLEAQLDQRGDASTENLRIALRRYRSFFERLLSV